MSGHYALLKMLRDQGYRLTPQREMVILTLHEAEGHLSAEQIHERVQAQNPCVDISTVYRTLDLLCEMGLVSQCTEDGHLLLYELMVRSPHHHLVCKQCHQVIEVSAGELESLIRLFKERYGFHADLNHLVVEGLCERCQADRQIAPCEEEAGDAHSRRIH